MGYMFHSAAVATIATKLIPEFEEWRKSLSDDFRDCVVGPIRGINGYDFIAFLPDGSKEGWTTSDEADAARVYMLEHFAMEGALVRFGGDEGEDYAKVDKTINVRGWKEGDWE